MNVAEVRMFMLLSNYTCNKGVHVHTFSGPARSDLLAHILKLSIVCRDCNLCCFFSVSRVDQGIAVLS